MVKNFYATLAQRQERKAAAQKRMREYQQARQFGLTQKDLLAQEPLKQYHRITIPTYPVLASAPTKQGPLITSKTTATSAPSAKKKPEMTTQRLVGLSVGQEIGLRGQPQAIRQQVLDYEVSMQEYNEALRQQRLNQPKTILDEYPENPSLRLQTTTKRAEALSRREENLNSFKEEIYKRLGISPEKGKIEQLETRAIAEDSPRFIRAGAKSASYLAGLGKAVARLPMEIPSGALLVGGRIALAADALTTSYGRKVSKKALKETPGAIIQSYDIRKPEGLLNLALTAYMIKQIGAARANIRGQQSAVIEQLKHAKVENVKVKVQKVSSKIDTKAINQVNKQIRAAVKQGKTAQVKQLYTLKRRLLATPTDKYVVTKSGIARIGKTKIPFQEKSIVTKKYLSGALKSKSLTKYTVGPKTIKIKTVIKGKQVEFSGPLHQGTVQTIGKIKGKGIKAEFVSEFAGKSGTTILKSKKFDSYIKTTIKKTSHPLKYTTIQELQSITKNIPKGKILKKFQAIDKSLAAKQAKLTGAAKTNIIKQRYNLNILSNKILGKKGQLAIHKPNVYEPIPGRDTSAIDLILKNMEQKLSRISKHQPSTKVTTSAIPGPAMETVFAGLSQVISPKVVIFPTIPIIKSSVGTSGAITNPMIRAATINLIDVGSVVIDKVIPIAEVIDIPDVTPEVGAIPEAGTKPAYEAPPVIDTFFTPSPEIPGIIIPRIIPIAALWGNVGGKPSSAFFKRAYGSVSAKYNYIPDLQSLLYGIRASRSQIADLLRPGRIYTGLEARPIV